LPTSRSSSSCCFSSTLMRSEPAIMWASSEGSSMLASATDSSSGRYGVCSMIWANVLCTLRLSASSSDDGVTSSGSSSMLAVR